MVTVTGRKLKMSQLFDSSGKVTPVTLIKLDQCLPDGIERGAAIKVIGISKGKGFAGVMKRWGFSGGPATHGQSDRERAPGSIGGTTHVGRVFKGKKMPGRLGGGRVTVKGLSLMDIRNDGYLVAVSGPVPGHFNSKVTLFIN